MPRLNLRIRDGAEGGAGIVAKAVRRSAEAVYGIAVDGQSRIRVSRVKVIEQVVCLHLEAQSLRPFRRSEVDILLEPDVDVVDARSVGQRRRRVPDAERRRRR